MTTTTGPWPALRLLVAATVVVTGMVGCADDAADEGSAPSTTPTVDRPVRTAVDIRRVEVEAVPPGAGVPQSSAAVAREREGVAFPVLSPDYVEEEYLLRGEADTYVGSPTDVPEVDATGNPYTTRILVRRPADDDAFSGRVFVEPFNTTNDADLDALWVRLGPALEENGDIWIGVTERRLGATRNQEFDPVRYADLDLTVNDYAWDILRQLGGLVKQGGAQSPLDGLTVENVYMGGYSQSGLDTATFLSAFHASTSMEDGSPVYDGYLPVAHSASLTEIRSGAADLPGFVVTGMAPVDVPVIDVETQSDVEGFVVELDGQVVYENPGGATVRREDSDASSDLFRLYELPGAPHVAKVAGCDGRGSSFPLGYYIRAASDLLFAWAEEGTPPPSAERIALADLAQVSTAEEDDVGNAVGGVRSPHIEIPLVDYDVHAEGDLLCALQGDETPLAPAVLEAEYGDVDGYLEEFTTALDATIDAGFLREADRAALLEEAEAKADELFDAG